MNDNMNIPIVKLEVESMRHSIRAAMTDHLAQMDTDFQAAIDEACSAENVRAVLLNAVDREMRATIEGEIKEFFAYGFGRTAICELVRARLQREIEEMREYQALKEGEGDNE